MHIQNDKKNVLLSSNHKSVFSKCTYKQQGGISFEVNIYYKRCDTLFTISFDLVLYRSWPKILRSLLKLYLLVLIIRQRSWWLTWMICMEIGLQFNMELYWQSKYLKEIVKIYTVGPWDARFLGGMEKLV